MSKIITPEEARILGMYDRHCFSATSKDYRGAGLYVIEFERGIKIGISNKLRERIKTYEHPWCQVIRNIRCYKHPNPRVLETFLKKTLVRPSGEDIGSTEFIVGNSFDYIIKFVERNHYYASAENRKKYVAKPFGPGNVLV